MGGKNNMFNQLGSTLGQATGLMENKAYREDPRLKAGAAEAQRALIGVATGKAPSVSAQQYTAALDQSARMAQNLAASNLGVNPALAQRNAMFATQEAQAGAAQQSAIMAEEERRRAQELILGMANQRRSQALAGQEGQQGRLLQTAQGVGQAMMGGGMK
jgi:hypothetical protein